MVAGDGGCGLSSIVRWGVREVKVERELVRMDDAGQHNSISWAGHMTCHSRGRCI